MNNEERILQMLETIQTNISGVKQQLEEKAHLPIERRVEALEDDVAMLKDVVKLMRQEIAELKKAQ